MPERGILAWLGALVVACSAGISVVVLWWFVGTLPYLLLPESPGIPDLTEIPLRSFLSGLAIGIAIVGEQALRMVARSESQLPGTLARDFLAGLIFYVASWLSVKLTFVAVATGLVIGSFALCHIFVFAFSRTWCWLRAVRLSGVASLLSAIAFAPVCGGAVLADELAPFSEPAGSVDANDLVSALYFLDRETCFLTVDEWRGEAIRMAQGSGLRREDAEDVVGSVILSVCTTKGYRADLRSYFFGAVKKRTADPWRGAARRQRLGDAWRAEPWHPAPTPETIVEETNGCVGRTMRTLPDEQRSVLVLTIIQDRTLDEAVTILGRSRSALDRSKQKALEALRKACPDG